MEASEFIKQIKALIENQGNWDYVALAHDEFGLTYLDEVPEDVRPFIIARATALYEEDQ